MAKKRCEIDESSKWDLSSIFKSDEEAEKEYISVSNDINEITKYKDDFTKSADKLLEFLKFNEKLERRIYKLFYYAHLSYDAETTDSKNQERYEKIENLLTTYSSFVSFFEPGLLKEDYDYILGLCDENKELNEYKFKFEQRFRYKDHTLSEKEENLLAKFSKLLSSNETLFSVLNDSDLKFGEFIDSNGEKHELNKSNYSNYMMSNDISIRKNAFNLMYDTYASYKNTFASTLRGHVEHLYEVSKLRRYNSSIEASLYSDNVDVKLYNNLIDTVCSNLNVLYKYYDVKKKMLGLDEFHMYDVYVPVVAESNKEYTFEEAKNIVIDALSILGDEYISIVKKAFNERWIDVYYTEGKRGGAYSSGFYDTNPFLLLDFDGKLYDVSTLAHELGHSVHTYLSCKNNSYTYSSYEIFVAEVASTVNELLLAKHLLKVSKDKNEKISILNELLDLFKGTIFRQTMFAEFERDMHELYSKGNVLTNEVLCDNYLKLVKKYFGPDVVVDEKIKYEWERIPHFYYSFYVYKYAIGLSCACYIVDGILSGKENAKENYIKFLKSGGSDYPANELKIAGVDVYDKNTVLSAIKMFADILDEFNALYNE